MEYRLLAANSNDVCLIARELEQSLKAIAAEKKEGEISSFSSVSRVWDELSRLLRPHQSSAQVYPVRRNLRESSFHGTRAL